MDSKENAARWRARTWRVVERLQREPSSGLRLVPGTATGRTPRRARLRPVGGQADGVTTPEPRPTR